MTEAGYSRTGVQCRQRWESTLKPGISREKWTADEDQMLRNFHEELGDQWAKIARRMDEAGYTRTDGQCEIRWKRTLNLGIRHGKWTAEEDQILRRLHEELGDRWAEIARRMTEAGYNRTNHQCRVRWGKL
jgi:hypothetical protein